MINAIRKEVTLLSKILKMLCLIILVSAILLPTSAFAASSDHNSKKSFFSGFSSIFSFLTSSNTHQKNDDYGKHYSEKDWGGNWWNGGRDKGNDWDKDQDDDDDDDDGKWDKDKHNSRKLWKNYYCW